MGEANQLDDKLFPTKSSFALFISYISLFVSQGLLVTAVQKSHIHGFNAIVVVLLTELVKLLICVSIYLFSSRGTIYDLIKDLHANRKLLVLYLAPALLYCLYNNLTFINLALLDLTTYYCLMQFRIVLTALIYQILFRRQLTLIQWASLMILTIGCLIKEYGFYAHISQQNTVNSTVSNSTITNHTEATRDSNSPLKFLRLSSLLLIQMFCSCFAGVYNEYLLKDSSTSKTADVIIQNIFMYLDSIICNVVVLILAPSPSGITGESSSADKINVMTTLSNLLTSPLSAILVLNNACSGLVASFFLKSLNSILKTFASSLELFAVALLAWILFGDTIDAHTIVALILVSAAMIVYSRKPVSVAPPSMRHSDKYELLSTSED